MLQLATIERGSPPQLQLSHAHRSLHCCGSHQEKLFERQYLEQMAWRQDRNGETSERKLQKSSPDIRTQPCCLAVERQSFPTHVSPASSTSLLQTRLWQALHSYANSMNGEEERISLPPFPAASSSGRINSR